MDISNDNIYCIYIYTNMFQRGWNHQPDYISVNSLVIPSRWRCGTVSSGAIPPSDDRRREVHHAASDGRCDGRFDDSDEAFAQYLLCLGTAGDQ